MQISQYETERSYAELEEVDREVTLLNKRLDDLKQHFNETPTAITLTGQASIIREIALLIRNAESARTKRDTVDATLSLIQANEIIDRHLPSAGATFVDNIDPNLRIKKLSLEFMMGNVDVNRAWDFRFSQPERHAELMNELEKMGGFPSGGRMFMRSGLKDQDNHVMFDQRYNVSSQTDVNEITRIEILGRKNILQTYGFYKKYVPGFEHCYLSLSAPQLGTRGARRVIGKYNLSAKDMDSPGIFEDTIAIFPDVDRGESSMKHPHMYMPYRCLVPEKVENLLVACRAFASDDVTNNIFNLIPHCIALGEAAGTAAAIAVKDGVKPANVNIGKLQETLAAQVVILPPEIKEAGKTKTVLV